MSEPFTAEMAATLAERQRIIQLLIDDVGVPCLDSDPMNEHQDDYCNCRIIGLIMGQNK
jgi:hypothetical protein